MRIQVRPFYDEYVYKVCFLFFGIMYWVYGFWKFADSILSILVVVTLIPALIRLIQGFERTIDFRIVTAIGLAVLGCGTILLATDKRATLILLLYTEIKILVLGYSSKKKTKQELESELDSIVKIIILLGTVIILISIIYYFKGISIPYVLNENEDIAFPRYIGRDPSRDALTGIFANPNMLSNLCVIYLGSLLYDYERTKHKLFCIILTIIACGAQILTASRGGLVGILVVLTIYLWFKFKDQMSKSITRQGIRVVIIISVGFVVLFILLFTGKTISVFKILNRTNESFSSNTQIRIYLWEAAARATFQNIATFFFGMGNNIADVMERFTRITLPKHLYKGAHNAYLTEMLEYGVPATIIIIIYFGKVIQKSWRYMKQHPGDFFIMVVLLSTLLSLLITSIVEGFLFSREFEGTIPWIIAGYMYSMTIAKEYPSTCF